MSFNRKKYGLFCKYVYIFAVILQKYSDNSICFFFCKNAMILFLQFAYSKKDNTNKYDLTLTTKTK